MSGAFATRERSDPEAGAAAEAPEIKTMRELGKLVILQAWWEAWEWSVRMQNLAHENFARMKFEEAWNA